MSNTEPHMPTPTPVRGSESPKYPPMALEPENASAPLAILVSTAAAVLGAIVWAAVTVATNFQIGWMAIGVGFLVGLSVRQFGRGTTLGFRVIGAALALIGCVLGNLLTVSHFAAAANGVTIFDVVSQLDMARSIELLTIGFAPMDILFYVLAVYAGYKYSVQGTTA